VAVKAETWLEMVHKLLTFLEQPEGLSNQEHVWLVHFATWFFLDDHILWKQDLQGMHKQVLY